MVTVSAESIGIADNTQTGEVTDGQNNPQSEQTEPTDLLNEPGNKQGL